MKCECCTRTAQFKELRDGEQYYVCDDHKKMGNKEFFRDYENKHKKKEVRT